MTVRPFGKDGYMIICARPNRTPPRCLYCRMDATQLCDFELPGGKTCDRRMCKFCTWSTAAGQDFCPEHHAAMVKS